MRNIFRWIRFVQFFLYWNIFPAIVSIFYYKLLPILINVLYALKISKRILITVMLCEFSYSTRTLPKGKGRYIYYWMFQINLIIIQHGTNVTWPLFQTNRCELQWVHYLWWILSINLDYQKLLIHLFYVLY